jgi:putative membrane protein
VSTSVQLATPVETPWRRLDPRMLVIGPINGLVQVLPVAVVLLVTGQGDVTRLWITGVIAGLVVVGKMLTWQTTRYRITPERVELHSGWLNRQRRSVPRDRIRTVDLTARLLHRVFGLSVVQVSAGAGTGSEHSGLSLDAVSKAEAERLRRELLERAAAAAPDPGTGAVGPPVQELARLHWSWLRLAPLTFSSLAGMAAIGGTAFNLIDELGVDPRDIGPVDEATARLVSAPIWVGILIIAGLLLLVSVVGALVLFAERWFGYRLTREPGADGASTLRVKRGLLTRRSLSVAEDRLRGAEIVEPLLLRVGRGAQCRALSTGLTKDAQGGALQPPVPRQEAHRVASAALRADPAEITRARLRPHPRQALLRRLTRALVPTAAVLAIAFWLGWLVPELDWLGPASLVLVPLALLVALDRYRNLGHQLTAEHLVSRQGSLVRRTVALQKHGVIGWTIRQSIFQRRAGLVTLEAVTAAGQGGYQVLDLAAGDAAALADATTPQLLP